MRTVLKDPSTVVVKESDEAYIKLISLAPDKCMYAHELIDIALKHSMAAQFQHIVLGQVTTRTLGFILLRNFLILFVKRLGEKGC